MKVADLSEDLLNYYVAMACGYSVYKRNAPGYSVREEGAQRGGRFLGFIGAPDEGADFAPHTCWAQGGPLIERFKVSISAPSESFEGDNAQWMVNIRISCGGDGKNHFGETPLIAAMRAIVAKKFGAEVDEVAV